MLMLHEYSKHYSQFFCRYIQRPLWYQYYQNSTALIYVVDSNDRDRIELCKYEIHRLMQEEELKDIPMLVMANKQDLPNAMSIAEITDKLDLHKIKGNPWRKNNYFEIQSLRGKKLLTPR